MGILLDNFLPISLLVLNLAGGLLRFCVGELNVN